MKKFFLILYAAIVLIAIVVSIYLHVTQNKQTTETLPDDSGVVAVTAPLYAYSADGTQGPLIDPTFKAVRVDSDTGNTLLQETSNYALEYFADGQSFNITLLGTNLRQARLDAEQELRARFGLTEEQACLLEVHVGTTVSVSEEFSARELGLSFCPNRLDLPTTNDPSSVTPQAPPVVPDFKL
jgi:hypothetical protein